jgi:excisionase family DNA binding protein
MQYRPQFGLHENPASERRQGSRTEIRGSSIGDVPQLENPTGADATPDRNYSVLGRNVPHNAASPHAATGGSEHNRLLTVQQVADILHVPVSWVYGRTRKCSSERLPGIRLGKYWRFREEEIHSWIESQRGGHGAP